MKREKQNWEKEDRQIEIDILRADMQVEKWKIHEEMTDKEKVHIYENQLEGMVKQILLISEFVIRNTTAADVFLAEYNGKILSIPPGGGKIHFYDIEKVNLIDLDEIGAVKLRPYSAIGRTVLISTWFYEDRRLDTIPSTFAVEAKISNGIVIQEKASIRPVDTLPDVIFQGGEYYPKKYADRLESEVPF